MDVEQKGLLLVISGPSGVGKGTVIHALLGAETLCGRESYYLSISATTRAPRPGEIDGVDYFFVSKKKFLEMEERGELLEHAEYLGNFYGTPVGPVDQNAAAGRTVIFDIEVEGAMQIKQKRPEAVLCFLLPPDYETLEQRLRGRATENDEKIKKRLEKAREECEFAARYDYIIISDDVSRAADKLASIIKAESCRVGRRLNYLER